MSELSPNLAADFVAACAAGAAEAADAFGRTLDCNFTLGAPESGAYAAKPPAGFDGPGLVILLTFGATGLAIALPDSTSILPAWCANPDATGKSKLSTLALELSELLTPESLTADKFEANRVDNVSAALAAAKAAADAAIVTLPVTSDGKVGVLSLVWPLSQPAAIFAAVGAPAASASANAGNNSHASAAPEKVRASNFSQLPHYARSLLKINIPVSVHLATKRETVQEIVELVPGAIIKFEKGCDELLQMVVGGQLIAEGEAVKIGDKFGFRITSMLRPREHFVKAQRPRAS